MSTQNFGVTSPLNLLGPKPVDLLRTEELKKYLEPQFISNEDVKRRMEIIDKLNALVKRWIRDLSIKRNIRAVEKVGGKIFTFGSYKLGVYDKNTDIDALCVVPRHVSREDWFSSFFNILKLHSGVSDLRAINNAYVPLIKMNFEGIEIDLLFARLALPEVPDSLNLADDTILRNLHPKCVISLNGCRVTDDIMGSVPNIDTFRLALKAIKLWAKAHGIYSNVLGFLGGVSWAMLVARTCQLYPNAVASTIVEKLFFVFSTWEWPRPVLLKPLTNINLGYPVWDCRKSAADRRHIMPIITPSYPQQNSTFNVSMSSKTIMQEAFKRSLDIVQEIALGKTPWAKLFESPNFFKYKHYIRITANSCSDEDHLKWCGFVESKIRHLILMLERKKFIDLAHINPRSFTPKDTENNRHTSMWFIGLIFKKGENLNIDLTYDIKFFIDFLQYQAQQRNIMKKETMSITINYTKRLELSKYIDEELLKKQEKQQVSSDQNGNAGKHSDLTLNKRKYYQIMNNDDDGSISKKQKIEKNDQEQKQLPVLTKLKS